MLNKKFLTESPVLWALVGIVVALILLMLSLLDKNWNQSGILVILVVWMISCARKDYTIWKLTKK